MARKAIPLTKEEIPTFAQLRRKAPFEQDARGWYVAFHWTIDGTPFRRVLPDGAVATYAEAVKAFERWRERELARVGSTLGGTIRFFALCDWYVSTLTQNDHNISQAWMRINWLKEWFGDVPVVPENFSNEKLLAYVEKRKRDTVLRKKGPQPTSLDTIRAEGMKLVGIIHGAADARPPKIDRDFPRLDDARDKLPPKVKRQTYLPDAEYEKLWAFCEQVLSDPSETRYQKSAALWACIAMECANRITVGRVLVWDQITDIMRPDECMVNFLKDGEVAPENKDRPSVKPSDRLYPILLRAYTSRDPDDPYVMTNGKREPIADGTARRFLERSQVKCKKPGTNKLFDAKPHDIRRSWATEAAKHLSPAQMASVTGDNIKTLQDHYIVGAAVQADGAAVNFRQKRKDKPDAQ